MNNIAVTPYICMHALQIQNVKRNVARKASIKELNNEIINPIETQEELNELNDNIQNEISENNTGTSIDNLPEPLSNETNIGSEI